VLATLSITVDGRFERPRTRAVFSKENNAGKFFCGFSLLEKTLARYIGIANKNQFQGIMQAIAHNFKRLIRVQDVLFQGS